MTVAATQSPVELFEEIYAGYRRRVAWLFTSWGQDWGTAEDLAQELFTQLWRDLSVGGLELEEIDRLWGFLCFQARRTLSKHFRKGRVPQCPLDDGEMPLDRSAALTDPAPRPDAVVPTRLDLGRTLAMLPADQRRLVALRYLEGLSQHEVAAQTGLPESTVNHRLCQAVATLRAAEGLPTRTPVRVRAESQSAKTEALELYRASLKAGAPLSLAALGAKFGRSERWAYGVVRDGEPRPRRENREAKVRAQLRAEFAGGAWAPGELLPHYKQLAAQHGLDTSTMAGMLRAFSVEGLIERRPDGQRVLYFALGPAAVTRAVPAEPAPAPAETVAEKITAQLAAGMTDGTYPPGGVLPTADQLAAQYRASCHYIGHVLKALAERGQIARVGRRYCAPGAAPIGNSYAVAQVGQALRGEVESGTYPPGAALPSAKHLAERFGVSHYTTGAALRALATAGLAEKHAGRYHVAADLAQVIPLRPALVTNSYLVTGHTPTGADTFPTAQLAA